MHTQAEQRSLDLKLGRVAAVLRIAGWVGLWIQLGLAAASSLMLVFAISGRNFSQATAPVLGGGIARVSEGTTPGLGIGVFWAVCGVLALLFTIYLAFGLTRLAKRLRSPDSAVHPKKAEVIRVLRLGAIAGLVGMLLTILGGGATLGVLLAKSIAQPQGVAIYDPNRIIRSLDIFVAMANMNGIAAHFIGTATSLGLLNWLYRQ
ncbi:MAG TPA: DUF3611 family protein [Crinalium sp.]|jgi:hypothetical protein